MRYIGVLDGRRVYQETVCCPICSWSLTLTSLGPVRVVREAQATLEEHIVGHSPQRV